MAGDIEKAQNYFRRAKDTGGDEKNLARGLLHLVKHLNFTTGRDFKRATELLDQAWKSTGGNAQKKTAEALFLVARELKKKNKKTSAAIKSVVLSNIERNKTLLEKEINDLT